MVGMGFFPTALDNEIPLIYPCVASALGIERQVRDERRKCERLWSELYKHLKHPTTLSTIKFKGGRNNPLLFVVDWSRMSFGRESMRGHAEKRDLDEW